MSAAAVMNVPANAAFLSNKAAILRKMTQQTPYLN
jgi:hypothetical protein